MYSAYFDESGHPDNGIFMVVAGCVAEVDQWVHFEREWLEALAPLNTKVFHTNEFEKGNPPFDKLTSREADDLFDKLVGIICRRVEKNFSQVLRLADYNAINAKYVFAECYGFPYPVLARSCIGLVETWAEKHSIPVNDVRHFFENGAKHKGQIEWIAERDLKSSIPVFLEKKEFVPLQAGDLLAWCHHHYLTTSGKMEWRYEKALNRLAGVANSWGLINFEDPDRIPTVLEIPVRDPNMRYRSIIVKKDGKRRAVTRYWHKNKKQAGEIKRGSLVLPEKAPLNPEQVKAAFEQYAAAKQREAAETVK